MKTAKLELNSLDAAALYRGLCAHERELQADKDEAATAAIVMSLAAVSALKDKLAFIFEKTRPAPDAISRSVRSIKKKT